MPERNIIFFVSGVPFIRKAGKALNYRKARDIVSILIFFSGVILK